MSCSWACPPGGRSSPTGRPDGGPVPAPARHRPRGPGLRHRGVNEGVRAPAPRQRIQRRAEEMQRNGQDVSAVKAVMQRLGPAVQQGKWADAEKIVGAALTLLGEKDESARHGIRPLSRRALAASARGRAGRRPRPAGLSRTLRRLGGRRREALRDPLLPALLRTRPGEPPVELRGARPAAHDARPVAIPGRLTALLAPHAGAAAHFLRGERLPAVAARPRGVGLVACHAFSLQSRQRWREGGGLGGTATGPSARRPRLRLGPPVSGQARPNHRASDRRRPRGEPPPGHAMISLITRPATSVRRKSRPLWRCVSLVWSRPIR